MKPKHSRAPRPIEPLPEDDEEWQVLSGDPRRDQSYAGEDSLLPRNGTEMHRRTASVYIERLVVNGKLRRNWCIVKRAPNSPSGDIRNALPPKLAGPFPNAAAAKAAFKIMYAAGLLDLTST